MALGGVMRRAGRVALGPFAALPRVTAGWMRELRRLRLAHRLRHLTLCRVAHAPTCRGCMKCWYIKTPWPEVRADGSWE